ncbi:MAG: hypothetical protein ABI652_03800, partial [Acidobacteriota bacterium]
MVPPMRPVLELLARGATTTVVFATLLWLTGFLRLSERAFLREMIGRMTRRPPKRPDPDDAG